jgi:hypothetical protein
MRQRGEATCGILDTGNSQPPALLNLLWVHLHYLTFSRMTTRPRP